MDLEENGVIKFISQEDYYRLSISCYENCGLRVVVWLFGLILIFTKSYVFNSPSAESDTILGNSTSRWKKWKSENVLTLEEIYKK